MVLGTFMKMLTDRRVIDTKVSLIEVTEQLNSIMDRESGLQMQQSMASSTVEEMADRRDYDAFVTYNSELSQNNSEIAKLQDQLSAKGITEEEKTNINAKIKIWEKKNEEANIKFQIAQKQTAMIKAEYKRTEEIENQVKMRELKRQEKCLALRKEKLEEQASIFNEQKQTYGQLAGAEAKDCAPKFGLG